MDMRDKIAEKLMFWRHSSGPTTPSEIADQILAIEVEGMVVEDKILPLHYWERPATIKDVLDGKAVRS